MNSLRSLFNRCKPFVPTRLQIGAPKATRIRQAEQGAKYTFATQLCQLIPVLSSFNSCLQMVAGPNECTAPNTPIGFNGGQKKNRNEHRNEESSRLYHGGTQQKAQQGSLRSPPHSPRTVLKRNRSTEDDGQAQKKQRTHVAQNEGSKKKNLSVYKAHRSDRSGLPLGGPQFEESTVCSFLDVLELPQSVFVLVEWLNKTQGSRYSWEEVHHLYDEFSDDVVDFLVNLPRENVAAARALHMLREVHQSKVLDLDQLEKCLRRTPTPFTNIPKRYVELSEFEGNILMLVEWEQKICGSSYLHVEVSQLYRHLGDSFLATLLRVAQYDPLARQAIEVIESKFSSDSLQK